MDDVKDIAGGASRSVKPDNDQLVTGPDEFENDRKLAPAVAAFAADLLGADDSASGLLKARLLDFKVPVE